MPRTPRYGIIADGIVKRKDSPCNGCTERTPTCHGPCGRYKKYRIGLEEEKAKAYAVFIDEIKVDDYEIKKAVKKAKQRKR